MHNPDDLTSNPTTVNRLPQPLRSSIRVIWLALFALCWALVLAGIPELLATGGSVPDDVAAMFAAQGLPPNFHAFFKLLTDLLSLSLFSSISLLLFFRRRDDFMALYVGMMMMLTAFIYASATYREGWVVWIAVLLIALGETSQVGFFYLFPTGRFFPRWTLWIIAPLLVFRYAIWANIYINNVGQGAIEVGIVVLLILGGMVFQYYRYQQANQTQRQQVKFMLLGLSITVPLVAGYIFLVGIAGIFGPMSADNYFLLMALRIVQQFALFLFPLTIVLSILRFRLWNIDLAINRSLVYSILTIALALVFTAGFLFLRGMLAQYLVENRVQLAGVGAALIAGLTFNPIRLRLQHLIDRRIYHLRFDINQLNASQRPLNLKNPGFFSGRTLGAYPIGEMIGKGGMGEVYRSELGGRAVAVKVVHEYHADRQDISHRFSREAATTLKLSHPNIVQTLDYGDVESTSFMVMEFIDGPELSAVLKEHGIWEERDALALIRQIADALAYAHENGFVHRDIKPSNIMLRPTANGYDAVLMDFGVAKVMDAQSILTGTGTVGTIDYMAPEQIKEATTVDHRADVYALGLVLFEMLAGARPFTGTAAQVMFAHLQKPAPDVRDHNERVSVGTARAIYRALEKEPEYRFASVKAFMEALESR